MLEHFTINKLHVGGIAALEHFTAQNGLGQAVRTYLISCKVEGKSKSTLTLYSVVLRGLLALGDDLSPNQVRLFLLSCQERGLKPTSILNHYKCLKAFCNWLVNENLITESPMRNIKPPKVPRMIIKPFSRCDIDNLLLLCSGNRFLDFRNRAIILVFIDTGLRLSELAAIQIQDVDFDHGSIKVMGKGSKERVVGIGRATQKALLKYLLMRTDDFDCLWVTEERQPFQRRGIQIDIKRLAVRAGITDAKRGPHTFRHTAATMALRNGASPFDVQSLLGHSTLAMTRRYTETVNSEDALKAHRKFSPVDNMRL